MSTLLLLLLFALVGGVAAGLQGPLAGIMERHVGVMGSVFLVHPRHGWNFRALGDDEIEEDPEGRQLMALTVNNPASYYYAIQHNEHRDALESNQEAEPSLIEKLAVPMAIMLGLVMVGVFFLISRFVG